MKRSARIARARRPRRGRSGGACAPKVAPPPAPAGVLRYPDFVFPAPPARVGDARASGRARGRLEPPAGCRPAGRRVRLRPNWLQPATGFLSGSGRTRLCRARPRPAERRAGPLRPVAVAQAPRYGPALAGRAEALIAAGQREAARGRVRGGAGGGRQPRRPSTPHRRAEARPAPGPDGRGEAGRRRRPLRRGPRCVCRGDRAVAGHRVPVPGPRLVELRRKKPAGGRTESREGPGARPWRHERRSSGLGSVLEERGNLDDALSTPGARVRAGPVGGPEDTPRSAPRARADERASAGIRRHPGAWHRSPAATWRRSSASGSGRSLAAAKSRAAAVATDVRGHWASRWIVDVIRAGVMDVLPITPSSRRAVVRGRTWRRW